MRTKKLIVILMIVLSLYPNAFGATAINIGGSVSDACETSWNTSAGYTNQNVKTSSSPSFAGLNVDTNTLYVDSTNDRVGVKNINPCTTLDVNGVLCARASPLIIPANIRGVFLKYNSAYNYGSLWSYDYPNAIYKGLEIDTNGLEFQIRGVKVAEVNDGGVLKADMFGTIVTRNTTQQHYLGKNQVGLNGLDYAAFGYVGMNVANYAILQGADTTTYFGSGTGTPIYFYPGHALSVTLAADGTASFAGNTVLGDASTDTITCTGRLIPRTVASDPNANATAGSLGEIVFFNGKWYGKTTSSATDTQWTPLN